MATIEKASQELISLASELRDRLDQKSIYLFGPKPCGPITGEKACSQQAGQVGAIKDNLRALRDNLQDALAIMNELDML
jgi:hypothetical protein